MLIARTVAQARDALRPARGAGRRIGLVATMGALHDGHLSLLHAARAECDVVVMSLFVNPRQFDDAADLAGYPRDERRDAALAAAAGADVLFAPAPETIYPAGSATTVCVGGPSEGLESASRGTAHFAGVATVVLKLLNIIGPQVAYFGAKDAQQVAVVRRMVADLDVDCLIAERATMRESDGLAMSSRNVRLPVADRARAATLHRALRAVAGAIASGARDPQAAIGVGCALLDAAGVRTEYLEIVDPQSMRPLDRIDDGAHVLIVLAARLGGVRLIDNLAVDVARRELPVRS